MAEANPRWTGGKKEWTCENCGENVLGVAARLRASRAALAAANARLSGREDESIGRDPRPPQRQPGSPDTSLKREAEESAALGAEDRESQMMLQSGLHGPREDVQS